MAAELPTGELKVGGEMAIQLGAKFAPLTLVEHNGARVYRFPTALVTGVEISNPDDEKRGDEIYPRMHNYVYGRPSKPREMEVTVKFRIVYRLEELKIAEEGGDPIEPIILKRAE